MNEPALPRKYARLLPPSATLACTRLLSNPSANAASGSLCLSLCATTPVPSDADLENVDEHSGHALWQKTVARLVNALQQQLSTFETRSDLLRAHSEGYIGGEEPLAFYLDLNLLSDPPRPRSHKAYVPLPGELPKKRGRPRKVPLAPPVASPAAPVAPSGAPVAPSVPPVASSTPAKSSSEESARRSLPYRGHRSGRPS